MGSFQAAIDPHAHLFYSKVFFHLTASTVMPSMKCKRQLR
jgi:hypothetical protein